MGRPQSSALRDHRRPPTWTGRPDLPLIALERHRVRSAIHDGALPLLAGAIYQLRFLERFLDGGHAGRQVLAKARRLAQAAMVATRVAIAGTNGTAVATRPSANGSSLLALRMAIAGIVAEAVSNALVHAKARTIRADIRQIAGQLTVTVSDDGQGFSVAKAKRQASARQRLGLRLLRERARLVGGRVRITSRPSGGTVIRARIPGHSQNNGQG